MTERDRLAEVLRGVRTLLECMDRDIGQVEDLIARHRATLDQVDRRLSEIGREPAPRRVEPGYAEA